MGKAPAAGSSSPVKKSASSKASSGGGSSSGSANGGRTFDDALGASTERVERVESTTVNRESATHVAFAASRTSDFVFAPSPQYMRLLNDYCQWDRDTSATSSVLVVVSQPGNGKSALLAHWANARRQSDDGSHELIYEHYAGCSYDSVRLSLFLFRFMNQIKTTYALRDFELPREHDEEKLKFSFARCLEAAVGRTNHLSGTSSKPKRILLVLDGIDCIRNEDGGDSLSWLPTTFPSSVRIIVSATQTTVRGTNHLRCCKWVTRKPFAFDDDEDLVYDTALPEQIHDSHTVRELRRRRATFVVVEPLDEPSCRAILQLYEDKHGVVVAPEEQEMIVASPGSSSPLYVRLLLHALELFAFPAHDDARKQWLKTAKQTNELHVIYELLMKQWNALLLADLYDQFHRCKAAAETAHSGGAHSSSGSDANAGDRKLTRRATKRDVTAEHATAEAAATAATELENVQTAIEQRALLVRHTLSLLAVSRYGLSDADIAKLLGDAVPKPVCQQLLRLLRPHLMQIRRSDCGPASTSSSSSSDAVLLNDVSHNQLRLIVRYGFLRDDHLRSCYYRELAKYFDTMAASQRRIDELPVQLERCALWTSLQGTLVDIEMFQLWWSARNRQEFFAYWMVLRTNGAVHDPVDDFVRSLDEYVARTSPSADQVLALCLTITDFLRTWQRVDASKSSHVAVHRPEPPQLQEFITSLGNFSLAHVSERDARSLQHDIDALCIHADDGYYVRRWLWTQFPLLAVAFESRFLRNVLASRYGSSSSSAADASSVSDDNQQQQSESSSASHASSTGKSSTPSVLPKASSSSTSKPSAVSGKRKALSFKPVLPLNASSSSGASDAVPEDAFGAFEFLSPEHTEVSIGSVSKLESQLMDLRMRYDKLKFAAKEKSASLEALESRLADAKATARAAGQSASKMDELHEQIRHVGDETLVGRQRSEYYKAILRHCEVHPARDANTIESAESVVTKLKTDVLELQQRTQVVSYEKRLASIEVPKLVHVLEDKARMHDAALARLRWRLELTHRMTASLIASKLASFSSSSSDAASGGGKKLGSPDKRRLQQTAAGASSDASSAPGVSELVSTFAGRRTTTVEELSFLRAKDKLLHKQETTAVRQQKVASLKQYVGSAYKDDGILGALRQVGVNKPEDAQVYWQDQLDHATQLEAEEKRGEQRVTDARDKLAALQAQFVNLKLGGSSGGGAGSATATESLGAMGPSGALAGATVSTATTAGSGAAPPGSATTATTASGASEGVLKAHSVKLVEQQLADTTASNQVKKERAARLKALSEKLHLGLLHIAQIVGVASAQRMDSLALGDAIEQGVRLFLGDESHLQSSSSTNLRRKNSARVMGLAGQAGAHSLVPLDTRSADDKIRYNVRVVRSPHARAMNPYVDGLKADGDACDGDNEDDDASDSDGGSARSSSTDTSGVRRRQDIKNRAKMELQRKESEKKRAEKKRK